MVKNQGTKQREQRSPGDCWQWKANGQCSKGDNCRFRHDINKRAKSTQPNPSASSSTLQNEEMHREPKVPEAGVPVEECFDCPARVTSKELATIHSVKNGILQNACSTSRRMDADLVKRALMRTARLKNSLAKGFKKNGDKSAVAMLQKHESHDRTGRLVLDAYSSSTRQFGLRISSMEHPKSSSILRKNSNIRKPIRCVKFTKAVVRHADSRDQNPSLGMICPGEPHQRNPNAPKFEDRSQEETEWQEQGAREAAWKLAKNVFKLKELERAAFFSPSENRCLPASNLKPEEREFVVDSGASMHMISKKDLSDAEMITLTKSCSPTIVITANGEVQTHEEATVYVKELYIFLTMKVLEDTPAVLFLGKLCDEHGYSYEWIKGQKPHLIKHGFRIQCKTENFVPIVVPGLSSSSSSNFPSSTSMTPSRQEIDYPTSSSSSSTSPTTTVSSDSETRARADLSGIDSHPVSVSSDHVERKERRDPFSKPTQNPKPK